MKRNRIEAGWHAVLPLLIYLILFITIRSVLMELTGKAAVIFSYDALPDYPVWYTAAQTAVIGIASAGAALPLLREGKRAVMTLRAGSMSAFIARRRDSRFLMGILPIGTVCLSALLNLLLSESGPAASVTASYAALPLEAAVYGILTPFTEELVYRGIVWYRLRKSFPALQAALQPGRACRRLCRMGGSAQVSHVDRILRGDRLRGICVLADQIRKDKTQTIACVLEKAVL